MIYKIYMDNCPPCEALNKILSKSKHLSDVVSVNVSTREGLNFVKKFGIRGAPALIINDVILRKDRLAAVTSVSELDKIIGDII